MSARGSLSLGETVIAETKRTIPVSWLGFLSVDCLANVDIFRPFELDREKALENFAANEPFLTKLTKGKLNFSIANERLIDPIKESHADTIALDISELIHMEGAGPGLDLIVNAIADSNEQCQFELPDREAKNPITGDAIKLKGINLKNTQEVLFSACSISDTDLDNVQEYLDELVSGNVV